MDIRDTRRAHLRALVERHESAAAFARANNLDPTYISQLLNGHRRMGEKAARKMEAALGLPANFMDTSLDESADINVESVATRVETRPAPVISEIQAGNWGEAVDNFHPGDADDWEPVPATASSNVFWLRVVGDSMTATAGPSIPEGYLILVEPEISPVNGSLVVAKLTDSQEVTFKRLVIDAGRKFLKPLNPDYPIIEINGNCRIVGVVREAKIKF